MNAPKTNGDLAARWLLRESVLLLFTLASLVISCSPKAGGHLLYWGVYMDGVPWDMSKLDAFETLVNKRVSIVHWGQPWWHCSPRCADQTFDMQLKQYDAVRGHGAIPLVDWGSWDYGAVPVAEQPDFSLASIASGRHDDYIRLWAAEAKSWGHPFFLRFDWEMNGDWFPWSEQLNGNQPGDYVKAWRHVHDIFTQSGVDNVTWVWCVNTITPGMAPISELYPGDNYVDWVAIDGYNWSINRLFGWQSFSSVFLPTYSEIIRLASAKPIMIAEVATLEDGGPGAVLSPKAEWIRSALESEIPEQFEKIDAIVWFDWNAGDLHLSWPITSSAASTRAFAEGIGCPYFLPGALSGLDISPIQPPRGGQVEPDGARSARDCAYPHAQNAE